MRGTRKDLAFLDNVRVDFLTLGRGPKFRGINLTVITLKTWNLLFEYKNIALDFDAHVSTQHPHHYNKT